jgi:putative ABC transport system permease protein
LIKNYFKTAIRNLRRNGQFTFINIAGLVLATTVFLFIIEFVAFELKANRFIKNSVSAESPAGDSAGREPK